MYLPYVIPLFIVCLFSIAGNRPMMRTALAILGNWVAGTTFVYATAIYDGWWFSLVIDALAASFVLHQPAGKTQALIGWTFMAQILLHVVYAFSNHDVGAYHYWQVLTAIAFVQLLLLGGWIGGYRWRRYFGRKRGSRLSSQASAESLAP